MVEKQACNCGKAGKYMSVTKGPKALSIPNRQSRKVPYLKIDVFITAMEYNCNGVVMDPSKPLPRLMVCYN